MLCSVPRSDQKCLFLSNFGQNNSFTAHHRSDRMNPLQYEQQTGRVSDLKSVRFRMHMATRATPFAGKQEYEDSYGRMCVSSACPASESSDKITILRLGKESACACGCVCALNKHLAISREKLKNEP